jgi:2-aminobenzoate-CoA ligase
MLSYPPRELWPDRIYTLPELNYPGTLNACHELLDANIQRGAGPSPAIFFDNAAISYAELHDHVMRLAGVLRERGIQSGDRVILRLLNRPHFVSIWLALLRIGAVVVATPPAIKAREIQTIAESAEPSLLIVETDLRDELEKLQLPSVSVVDVGALRASAETTARVRECIPTPHDAPAIIAYTSGSTGAPKGCMHSHADLLAVTDSYARYILRPTPADRFGGHPTLAFVYSLGGLLLFPFRFGAATVLLDRFTPETFVETLRQYQVTVAFCAPTSLRMMMRNCGDLRGALRSLRCTVSAGETLPASVYHAWVEATGVEALDGIGSTEMLHIFISGRLGKSRPGTTGQVVPGYEAMVVDEQTLEPIPNGMPGMLMVKGPTGCRYLNLPDRQRQYVRNGWNLPGDLYVRDSDGFFRYQCRNDDLIICGGIKLAGPEVEGVLLEHPAVAEAAVVASPDELKGMVPKAFVVLRSNFQPSKELEKQLQQHVQHELAIYKYPRRVEFVPELPKTSTGKIRRTDLRRREFHPDPV